MTRSTSTKIIGFLAATTLTLLISNAYAQTSTSPYNISVPPAGATGATPGMMGINSSSGGSSGTNNLIGGYSEQYWTQPQGSSQSQANLYMFTESPSFVNTLIQNLFFENYLANIGATVLNPQDTSQPTTIQALNSLLTATPLNTGQALASAMSQYFPLTTPDYVYSFQNGQVQGPTVIPVAGVIKQNAQQSNADKSNINVLNLGALITPIQYGTNQYNAATNATDFINYVSNLYNPMPVIDFTPFVSNTNQLNQVLGMPTVQQYLYTLRRLTANYSVGINNLYFLYNERVPQDTTDLLGKQFSSVSQNALPSSLQQQASPLAIEQWMATYRLNNYGATESSGNQATPWVQAVENATPATLQRETLYLLAEIRYEMFQQRMVQERILATLSAEQMQMTSAQQADFQKQVTSICQSSPFSGTNACTSATASGTSNLSGSGS